MMVIMMYQLQRLLSVSEMEWIAKEVAVDYFTVLSWK
jgi:hypothetical protein